MRDPVLQDYFGDILDDWFQVKLLTGDVLVQKLLEAHDKWFSETNQTLDPNTSFPQLPETIPIEPVPT
ncbi:hypothetical protein K435DRAFT_872296 [Dendrothele bispora CBS 962.96]|uniref:Uncharacterized protein n=1 Tax=Dendrothele bispora (strain CBS 962.96) TaxID=1314807 RepID=A0A4V4HC95_DENBC|nr:hypothetical protein K435DRAFT_872296 [Dendrothele bispora CBS 962.96]